MAGAVIHNSDCASVDECKRAIDRHFREWNAAFAKSPRRAGNVIWGEEREPPIFSEANNCKDPRYRYGLSPFANFTVRSESADNHSEAQEMPSTSSSTQ